MDINKDIKIIKTDRETNYYYKNKWVAVVYINKEQEVFLERFKDDMWYKLMFRNV